MSGKKDEVRRTCRRCKGARYIQIKIKPGKAWTNVTCPRCGGTGYER